MFWNQGTNIKDVSVKDEGRHISFAGRVVAFRKNGGICFGHLYDGTGKLQFCFQKLILGDKLKEWSAKIQLGVHIGISGKIGLSSTGELTLFVLHFNLLQKTWKPFPDKFQGISGTENKLRKRYLDCVFDPIVNNVFRTRSAVISTIRNCLAVNNFMEFETPILTAIASGAHAKPFMTHHNALDADLFMRIAPETYLKRVVAAGYNKVFELGKQFRNEGLSPAHLQEFTSLEWYAAYWDYKDNLDFFHNDILVNVLPCGLNFNAEDNSLSYQDKILTFGKTPNIVSYRELFQKTLGANPDEVSAKEADDLFKTKIRPNIIQPTYLIDYPAHMSPMACRKQDDPNTVEQWQLIVNGWEIVKCYTELTDPVLQRQLLEEQAKLKVDGDEETMGLEEDFLECMEFGMPPMSGAGIGIDRLVCVLTNQTNLRDVVMFPTLLTK